MIKSCCVCGDQELEEVVVTNRHNKAELFLYCASCELRTRMAEAPKEIEYSKWNSELNFDLFLRHRFLKHSGDESILNLFCGGNLIVVDMPEMLIHYADFSKDALPNKIRIEDWRQVNLVDNPGYEIEQPFDLRYDTVMLLDVLEHTKNPIGLVKLAKSVLKEKGKILIETGNADLLRLDGWYFKHSDHVSGLTMKTLSVVADKCDLDVTSALYIKNKMWLGSRKIKMILIYVLRRLKNIPLIVKFIESVFKKDIRMLADPYTRDHIFVVLESKCDTAS